jgi:hypothetical protein
MGKLCALWSMTRFKFIGERFRLFGLGLMFLTSTNMERGELQPGQDHTYWSARQPHVRLDNFSIHFLLFPIDSPAQDNCKQIHMITSRLTAYPPFHSFLTFRQRYLNPAAPRQQYALLPIQRTQP